MNFSRLIANVKKNIRRTPYQAMAAMMVMFLTFFVVGVFLLLALGSQQILTYYESKPQAIAFFKDGTTTTDVEAIQNSLWQTNRVTELKYVSKEDALEIYRERNKNNPVLLELVTANILPSSLEIATISPQDLTPIVEIIRKEPVIEEVVYPEDVVKTLASAARVIRVVGISAVSFLLLFAILAVLMIVGFKIRVQRTEIETMKLLGASKWFIRSPYLLEGIFYGFIGVLISWIFTYGIMWYVSPFIQNALGELRLLPAPPLAMLAILGVEVLLSLIVGGIGSYAAVRRYLRL